MDINQSIVVVSKSNTLSKAERKAERVKGNTQAKAEALSFFPSMTALGEFTADSTFAKARSLAYLQAKYPNLDKIPDDDVEAFKTGAINRFCARMPEKFYTVVKGKYQAVEGDYIPKDAIKVTYLEAARMPKADYSKLRTDNPTLRELVETLRKKAWGYADTAWQYLIKDCKAGKAVKTESGEFVTERKGKGKREGSNKAFYTWLKETTDQMLTRAKTARNKNDATVCDDVKLRAAINNFLEATKV